MVARGFLTIGQGILLYLITFNFAYTANFNPQVSELTQMTVVLNNTNSNLTQILHNFTTKSPFSLFQINITAVYVKAKLNGALALMYVLSFYFMLSGIFEVAS